MNNKQLFDLTSPPSAEFDTEQELLWYCNNHAKQNGYAVATKNSKREKNITIKCDFVGEYQEFKNIPWQKKLKTNIIQTWQLSIWDIWQKNVDGNWRFVVKVPNHIHPASPPEAHPMHQHLDEIQFEPVIALTQAGVRPLQDLSWMRQNNGNQKASPWRASHGRNIQCRSCFFKKNAVKKEELWFVELVEDCWNRNL